MSVNKVTLLGRVGKDPELKYTQGGQAYARFSVATSKKWKDKQGAWQEKTEWHNIVVWGNTAEKYVGPYVKKGASIYIEGELQTTSIADDQGNKRYNTSIVASFVELTGSRNAEGNTEQANTSSSKPSNQTDAEAHFTSDEIPF